jgi:hypothetical protein
VRIANSSIEDLEAEIAKAPPAKAGAREGLHA